MTLFQLDLFATRHERLLNNPFITKLICHGTRAIGLCGEQVFNDACMTPAQDFIGITHPRMESVVGGRANRHDIPACYFANRTGQRFDAGVTANAFAITHTDFHHFFCGGRVEIDTGHNQRPKIIALATFIDAHPFLEHGWIQHMLITQPSFAEQAGFKVKLYEVRGSLALDDQLA